VRQFFRPANGDNQGRFHRWRRLSDASPVCAAVREYRPALHGRLTDASRRRQKRTQTFGQFDRMCAAFEVGADGNDPSDAGGLGAGNDFRKILCVIRVIKMRVGVVEDGHKIQVAENSLRTLNIEHRTLNIECRIANLYSEFDVECWMLDVLSWGKATAWPERWCR